MQDQSGHLNGQQRRSLERDGYLMVPSLLEETVLERITKRLEELVSRAVAAWAADPGLADAAPEGNGVVGAQLELADPDFAPCGEHPLVAEAATAVLGPYWHLAWLGVRVPLPGNGRQRLHRDFEQHRTDGPWQVLSAMWCITAFTPGNGPLRVIPGSHRVSEPPIDLEGWGMKPHPDEVKIAAPAGSLILFNSADLWHSGTRNDSPAPRLSVTAGIWPGGGPCLLPVRVGIQPRLQPPLTCCILTSPDYFHNIVSGVAGGFAILGRGMVLSRPRRSSQGSGCNRRIRPYTHQAKGRASECVELFYLARLTESRRAVAGLRARGTARGIPHDHVRPAQDV